MNQEAAGRILFAHFQREHYQEQLIDVVSGSTTAYDMWIKDRWNDAPQEVRDKYQTAAQNLIVSAQQSMQKDFADTVFYVTDGGTPQKIMSLKDMNDCAKFLSQQFDHNPRNVYGIGEIPYLAKHAIGELNRQISSTKMALEPFVDDLITCLRAISLLAASTETTFSRSVRDAQLQGLISIVEWVIKTIKNNRANLLSGYRYLKVDHFQSNYPVQLYLDQIADLKNQIKRLKGQEVDEDKDFDSME